MIGLDWIIRLATGCSLKEDLRLVHWMVTLKHDLLWLAVDLQHAGQGARAEGGDLHTSDLRRVGARTAVHQVVHCRARADGPLSAVAACAAGYDLVGSRSDLAARRDRHLFELCGAARGGGTMTNGRGHGHSGSTAVYVGAAVRMSIRARFGICIIAEAARTPLEHEALQGALETRALDELHLGDRSVIGGSNRGIAAASSSRCREGRPTWRLERVLAHHHRLAAGRHGRRRGGHFTNASKAHTAKKATKPHSEY